MSLYFFDIRDRDGTRVDDIGLELPDMDAAIAEGRRALGEIIKEALPELPDAELAILVRDSGEGPVLLTVTFTTQDLSK